MNIESLFNAYKEMRKQSAGNLTIGEILEKVNSFDDEEKIAISNGKHLDGTYDSYRGYYEDLYLGWDDKDQGLDTVGNLKKNLNKALDEGVMEGYKGGDFPINESTIVWVSSYGTAAGEMIVDIQKINGQIIMITKEE